MLIDQGSTPTVVFLMVDETDDETAETGLSPTVQISKNGGSFATVTNSVSEIANGWYKVALTATETNTVGPLIVRATATGADEWRTVHEVVDYDGLKADVSSLATSAALATVDGNVDDIVTAVETNIPATLAALNDLDSTAVQSAAAAALTAYDAPTKAEMDSAFAALEDVSAADIWTYVTRELTSGGGVTAEDVWTYATRELSDDTAVVDGIATDVGNLPTATEIADAVLSRGVSNVESTADLASLAELILAVLESARALGSWTIYETDHSTVFNTRTYTTDSGAEPIVEVD